MYSSIYSSVGKAGSVIHNGTDLHGEVGLAFHQNSNAYMSLLQFTRLHHSWTNLVSSSQVVNMYYQSYCAVSSIHHVSLIVMCWPGSIMMC